MCAAESSLGAEAFTTQYSFISKYTLMQADADLERCGPSPRRVGLTLGNVNKQGSGTEGKYALMLAQSDWDVGGGRPGKSLLKVRLDVI